MKKTTWFLFPIIIAFAFVLTALISPAQANDDANLLTNGGFEGVYQPWTGVNELRVAGGWSPFWVTSGLDVPGGVGIRPEFKEANPNPYGNPIFANRVRSGRNAQQWFTSFSTAFAGVYQRVPVVPGSSVRLSAWTHAWSSDESNNPNVSTNPAWVRQRVGIDPLGGTDPTSPSIIWSMPGNFLDNWGELAVEAQAMADNVTVYLSATPNFAMKHNDIYYDDARLVVVSFPLPTPAAVAPGIVAPAPTPDPLVRGLVVGRGVLPGQQGISSVQPASGADMAGDPVVEAAASLTPFWVVAAIAAVCLIVATIWLANNSNFFGLHQTLQKER